MKACFHVMASGDRLPSNAEHEMTAEPPHRVAEWISSTRLNDRYTALM